MSISIGNQAAVFVEGPHFSRVMRFSLGRQDSQFFCPDFYKKRKDHPLVYGMRKRFFSGIDQVAVFVNSQPASKFYYTGYFSGYTDIEAVYAKKEFGYQIRHKPKEWRKLEAYDLATLPESVRCIVFSGSLGFSSEHILLEPIEVALSKGQRRERRLVYITAKNLFDRDRNDQEAVKRNNIDKMVRLLLQHNGGLFFFDCGDCGEYLSGNILANKATSWGYNI